MLLEGGNEILSGPETRIFFFLAIGDGYLGLTSDYPMVIFSSSGKPTETTGVLLVRLIQFVTHMIKTRK